MKRRDIIKFSTVAAASLIVAKYALPSGASVILKAPNVVSALTRLQPGRYFETGPNDKRISNDNKTKWTIAVDQNSGDHDVIRSFEYIINGPDSFMSQKYAFHADKSVVLTEEVVLFSGLAVQAAYNLKTSGASDHYDRAYDKEIRFSDSTGKKRISAKREIRMDSEGGVSINGKAAHGRIAMIYRTIFDNVGKTCDAYIQAKNEINEANARRRPLPEGPFYRKVALVLRRGTKPLESVSTINQPFLHKVMRGALPIAPPQVADRNKKGWFQRLMKHDAG